MDMDNEYWEEEEELEHFCCVLGDKCMMPSPFHFPSECHTAEDYENQMSEQIDEEVQRLRAENYALHEVLAAIITAKMNHEDLGDSLLKADKFLNPSKYPALED